MTPTPEQLELAAAILRGPFIPWQHKPKDKEEWIMAYSSRSCFSSVWDALVAGHDVRMHPDHTPKPEPTWSISTTVPTLLIYADADGATKFGAIQKQDEESIWFFNFAKAYVLDKSTGEVAALDPEP